MEAKGGGGGGGGKGGGGKSGGKSGGGGGKVTRERVEAPGKQGGRGESKQEAEAKKKVKSKFRQLGKQMAKVNIVFGMIYKGAKKVIEVFVMLGAAVVAVKAFNDAVLAAKRNLKEYSGTVAEGFARLEHQARQLAVVRGKELQTANSMMFKSSMELEDALAPVANDIERIKTTFAVGMNKITVWFLKIIDATQVLDRIADWTESIAKWFGWEGDVDDDKAPQELYQEMVGMIASGDFTSPHTEDPAPK